MPTGYTSGILEGKINTFEEYAKICMRAFGATIHLRDENLDAKYKERVPDNYHGKEIIKLSKLLNEVKIQTDELIVSNERNKLKEEKKNYLETIEKRIIDFGKLSRILMRCKIYQPPSPEFEGIKKFMIDQIEKTMDFDCDITYYQKEIETIDQNLSRLIASLIRKKIISETEKSLNYHNKELKLEIERCQNSNKWVEDFLNSLK